jgi:hypothetical protein
VPPKIFRPVKRYVDAGLSPDGYPHVRPEWRIEGAAPFGGLIASGEEQAIEVAASLSSDPGAARETLRASGFEDLGNGLWGREEFSEAIAVTDGAVWVQSPGSLSPAQLIAFAVLAEADGADSGQEESGQ